MLICSCQRGWCRRWLGFGKSFGYTKGAKGIHINRDNYKWVSERYIKGVRGMHKKEDSCTREKNEIYM